MKKKVYCKNCKWLNCASNYPEIYGYGDGDGDEDNSLICTRKKVSYDSPVEKIYTYPYCYNVNGDNDCKYYSL